MQQLLRALLQDENAEISSGVTPITNSLGIPCNNGCGVGLSPLGVAPFGAPLGTFGTPFNAFNTFNRFDDFNLGLGRGVNPLALLALLYVASRFTRVQQPQFVVPPIYIIDGKT